MEQNKVNENREPIRGIDLLRLFTKKLKPIIIIGLVFAIVGGVAGVLLTSLGATYVAEVKISVTPIDDSDRLLFNLRSGRFAEVLLLEENGLPPKAQCNAEDYDEALKALEAYEDARERRWDKYVESSLFHMTDIDTTYKRLESEYNAAFELLKMYKEADGEGFVNNEDHLKMIALCEEKLLAAEAAKLAYYNDYYLPADQTRVRLQAELATLKGEVDVTRREADEAVEKVLVEWRKLPEVKESIKKISSYTLYNYFESDIPKVDESKDATAVNKGYIQITVVVPANEKEFAVELADAYAVHIESHVEKQVEYISGRPDVECVLTDPVISVEYEADSVIAEAVKYAVVAGAIAVVITYLLFMCRMLLKAGEKHPSEENK